ncbi:hypothetical protein RJ640_004172 [Escallonia rubra]|uniref:AMP-dependent synthetase/ligase domain-containing protein n=1 Tax=Escallonia rubra TaxID=112253 RepID=A0AA88QF38_9ASTE|nr:hypothetical protein RJ640_004172 [Escallonia rubra]
MERSGYGRDGIYRSLRPRPAFPTDPSLSMVSFLFRNARSYPEKPALFDADTQQTLTFRQFESTVSKFSHALLQLGIKKNDVVLIYAPNSIQFPLCFFGVIAAGAITTTVNLGSFIAKINFKMARQEWPKAMGSLVVTTHRDSSQCTTMETATA